MSSRPTWKPVPRYAAQPLEHNPWLASVADALEAAGIEALQFARGDAFALLVPENAFTPAAQHWLQISLEAPQASGPVALVSPEITLGPLEELLDSVPSSRRPRWIARAQPFSAGAESTATPWLGALAPRGRLRIRLSDGRQALFPLYDPPPSDPSRRRRGLLRGARKRAEGPDNLRRREEWFRGRSGA